jgi:RNA-splicing ligase RtcB
MFSGICLIYKTDRNNCRTKYSSDYLKRQKLAKFSPAEQEAYEESLKYYRDLKNVVDTSREEGVLEGIEKRGSGSKGWT